MLVGDARATARAWVAEHAAQDAHFRGAFFSGSAAALPEDSALPGWSDVDVVVVVSHPTAPPKLGKFVYRGVLLEVTYLPWTALASVATVAASYTLAPSFSSDQVILDPTGQLGLLRDEISPRFGDPAAVRLRYEDAISRIDARLSTLDPTASWHDQVTAWMFPTSVTTHVVLVAALRNPTVRLRYLAAREVLRDHDQDALYLSLLRLLGCDDCDRQSVQHHLDRLAVTFDQAVPVSRTPFFFSTDITRAARPIAIDGSQHLIDGGDHREAVFWIIATYARCQKIFAAEAPAHLRDDAELRFRDAVTDLLGVHDSADLLDRREAVRALLPALRQSAATIATSTTRPRTRGSARSA